MEQGDRLVDALKAAGGANEDAQLDLVNLSLRIVDEGHYHIPRPGETPSAAAALSAPAPQGIGTGTQGSAAGTLVNLNSAPVAVLETLPGIGPTLARRIIADREQNGRFARVDDLRRVRGIGPRTGARLKPWLTVRPRP